MGLHVPLHNLVPLYFLAVIIGIFSMIPGGIGSFDLIVITGLTSMGVKRRTKNDVTWFTFPLKSR